MTSLAFFATALPVALTTTAYYTAKQWRREARREAARPTADEWTTQPRWPEETGPTWYPPGPSYEDLRWFEADLGGRLYCPDHDVIHAPDAHCTVCYDEWSMACNEREVARARAAGEPYYHADGRWYADEIGGAA